MKIYRSHRIAEVRGELLIRKKVTPAHCRFAREVLLVQPDKVSRYYFPTDQEVRFNSACLLPRSYL